MQKICLKKTSRMILSGFILWISVLYIDRVWLIPAWGQRMTVTKNIRPSHGFCVNITMKEICSRLPLLLVVVSECLIEKFVVKIILILLPEEQAL